MRLTFLTVLIAAISVFVSNAQHTLCSNGNEATFIDSIMTIYVTLCADDNMIYLDITYHEYNDNWFGIVFSDSMIGNAAIYTTGKSNEFVPEQGLYPYTLSARSLSAVDYDVDIIWTKQSVVDTPNGFQIIYSTTLSNYGLTSSIESFPIRYAYGSSLTLTYHIFRSEVITFDFTGSDSTTTTLQPGAKGCDAQDLLPTTAELDDFTVEFFLNCDDETVTVTITYNGYNDNWFGIVFSESMIGNALIYTTGKSGDRDIGLYPYILSSRNKDTSGVNIDNENEWTKLSEELEDGTITVTYQQDLTRTIWTRETENVPFKWAKGKSLTLEYHDYNGRSSSSSNLNLLTGTSSTIKDDLSAQTAHGVIMWFAWTILASWGIMSSRFRWLYPKGPIWFKIHRGVQAAVVILDIIGFLIAFRFTQKRGVPHFSNPHMVLGLIVTVLAILQPINALFRVHPPARGWFDGKKPIKRIIWEWIHKGFGYITWILGCITVTLGLELLGEYLFAKFLLYLWCLSLLISFIGLAFVGHCKKAEENRRLLNAPDPLETSA